MFKRHIQEVTTATGNEDLREAVSEGLAAKNKYIPSRFFYDEHGDDLFRQIMDLPEYYPTRCEAEILETYRQELLEAFGTEAPFQLIELGAGDGEKTRILLQHFTGANARFSYVPTDISEHVLELLTDSVKAEIPTLQVNPVAGEYSEVISQLNTQGDRTKRIVMFLGSSIGNFSKKNAASFLQSLAARLNSRDKLLIGFDLKKDPDVIFRAYNDAAGVTREFNFNLLHRINRELDADFRYENFRHYPVYDPVSGEMRSYLVAESRQEVHIAALGETFVIEAWEPILTEISTKYSEAELHVLAAAAGYRIERLFFDSKRYYTDALLVKLES